MVNVQYPHKSNNLIILPTIDFSVKFATRQSFIVGFAVTFNLAFCHRIVAETLSNL